ncbi:MAG: ImmA/IrrE family metallo-endopeptidase [Myxococcales bacterium]
MTLRFARNQAERVLRELRIDRAPVDLKVVAEHLGLRIAHEQLGDGLSGALVTHGEKAVVCVQASDHPHRKRFTIAHEIGHFVLRHQFEKGAHVIVDRGNLISFRGHRASEGVDPKEIDANHFAACLLMPEALLFQAVDALGGSLHDHDVENLARTFQVSEQAMTLRLGRLGLL